MSGAAKRGALIVFEGCDRSGKTTQVSCFTVLLLVNNPTNELSNSRLRLLPLTIFR